MAEDRLEKLVRRYQKAAEKKTAGESIGANVTNMLFRSGKTSAAKVFAKTAAPKICIFMTVPRPTPLISWLRRCWPN